MRSRGSIRSKVCPTQNAIARGSASSPQPRSSTSRSPRRAGATSSKAARPGSADARLTGPMRRVAAPLRPGGDLAIRCARAEEECPDAQPLPGDTTPSVAYGLVIDGLVVTPLLFADGTPNP